MKFLRLGAALLMIVLLMSCADASMYNRSAIELATAASDAAPLEAGYYSPSDSYFLYYFSDDDDNISADSIVCDWAIMKSSSQSSENEMGVLLAKDGCLQKVKKACQNYLEDRREAYLESKASYSPGEYEKYRDAECFSIGNYVIYLILDLNERNAARYAIESMLSN